jgi:hypothetical protein
MADPLSIAAILALVYAGRKMSQSQVPTTEAYTPEETSTNLPDWQKTQFDSMTRLTRDYINPGMPEMSLGVTQHKDAVLKDTSMLVKSFVHGEPTRDFSDRTYVSGKMHGVSPFPQILVGPGLGLDPSVQAAGGFHQFFRVMPNNVGAYRLTSLPGRANAGFDFTGGKAPTTAGELTKFGPSKVAYIPTRRPPVPQQGQSPHGGPLAVEAPRGEHEKGKMLTRRSQTGYHNDGLNFGPAKSIISGLQVAQNPTRNKADNTTAEFTHSDFVTPNISSFKANFVNSAEAKILEQRGQGPLTSAQLQSAGLRGYDEKREKKDRAGNKGRMNVRGNPINQNGMLSSVRSDTSKADGFPGFFNGQGAQNYVPVQFQDNNPYKGTLNRMDFSAREQVKSNPYSNPSIY